RLDCSVDQQVTDGKAARLERPRHQQAAVAIERLALGTQETQAIAARALRDAGGGGGGGVPARHRCVIGDAVLAVETWIARAAAERVAERYVGDAFVCEPRREARLVEPGIAPRCGRRAHVGDRGYFGAAHEFDEALDRVVGMPDG